MKNRKHLSTFQIEMSNPDFKNEFDKEYQEFALSELLLSMMEENEDTSVRKLAKAAGISPSIIQKIRTGEQKDIRIKNFIAIINELGFNLVLEKGERRIPLAF